MIDVIMPAHPKDLGTLDLCIESIRSYVKDVRRIIVVSNKKLTDNAEWFNLDHFPFDGDSVRKIHGSLPKNGWFLMQLIKFYAPVVIPDITQQSLSCDTDAIFLNPVYFTEGDYPRWSQTYDLTKGKAQGPLNAGRFMQKLHPEIYTDGIITEAIDRNVYNIESMVAPYVFDKSILKSMMKDIESYHKEGKFWEIFLKCSDRSKSGSSEHQVYFLYCVQKYRDILKYSHRYKWSIACSGTGSEQVNYIPDKKTLDRFKKENYHWRAFQSHMRGIRTHNYKELCLICGKPKKQCIDTGCDNANTRQREMVNII